MIRRFVARRACRRQGHDPVEGGHVYGHYLHAFRYVGKVHRVYCARCGEVLHVCHFEWTGCPSERRRAR